MDDAASSDYPEIVESLLNAGAEVNGASESGVTPLMIASAWGSIASMQMLLTRGASLSLRDSNGWDALDYARYKYRDEAAATLIQAGAMPEKQS